MARSLFFLGVCLWATAAYQVTVAQAESDQFFGEGEDLLFAEIESVYSASKYDQKVTEAPARVSIVTAEEIQRYGFRTIGDILNSLPGFSLNYDRNYSYIGVRGFGVPGDYNTRLLFLVDGHRLNDNIYNAVGAATSFYLDVDLIDRVEVVRGPSSSLYGSNAFFGIIHVITKKGRDLNGVELSAAVGSQDSYQGRCSFGQRFQNGFEILLSGSFYDSEGDESLYFREFDDPATNNGVFENGDDDQFTRIFARMSLRDFSLELAYNNREKGIPTAPWGVEFNDNRTRTWDKSWFVDLKYQHFYAPSNTDVTFRLFYDSYQYDGDYTYDYGPPPDIVINKDADEGTYWGTEIQLSRLFFNTHRFTAGGEYRDSVKQDEKNYDVYGVWLDSKQDIDTWGLFIQDEWTIADNLLVNIGIRRDEYDHGDDATNPRLALIYSPVNNTSLKFLYGEAFRAPNSYELYYHDGYTTTKPALDLDPETIQSYELVWEQTLSRHLRGSFSLYHNVISDLIAYTEDPHDGLLVFENSGDATATGAEVSLEGQWDNGLQVELSYSYQDAEDDETGERLVNAPRHMVKTTLMAPIIAERVHVGLEMQYDGGRKTIAADDTDNFLIMNLTLIGQDIIDGMTFSASIYNLFNKGYDFPASAEHSQDVIEQDGRIFWFKVSYLF